MKRTTTPASRELPQACHRHLQLNGMRIAYTEQGRGETVVLLHCNGSSRHQWQSLMGRLAGHYRVLAPDLFGHGDTPFPDRGAGFTAQDEVAATLALVETAGAPCHLVGHSYGGAIALRTAFALGNRLRSLTLVEPALFELLRQEENLRLWQEIRRLAMGHIHLVEKGALEEAAHLFMSYWIGAGNWRAMPHERKAPILKSISAIAGAWKIILGQEPQPGDHEAFGAPTMLLKGSKTRDTCRRVVELLASRLPSNQMADIQGAGHMAPITHPDPVNAAIETHIIRNSKGKSSGRPIAA